MLASLYYVITYHSNFERVTILFGEFTEKYYPDGILKFEGIYKDGVANGYGKSYYPSGRLQYEGMWANNTYHGNGTLYDEASTVIYSGEWVNGRQFQGQFERKFDTEQDSNDLDQYIHDLNSLIGLMGVKREMNSLINFVKIQKLRSQKGLKTPEISLHMVFTGNPGTGKTTVARLLSKILFELGYLSKGHIIETNRAGLVAGYLGQTALKTEEVIKQALGGVLFIDEAYTLASDDEYGQEAIDTLLKMMEDYRNNLVVIVAGYPKLMQKFIDSNPGLASRFNRYIIFEDYSLDELMDIFNYICANSSYTLDDAGQQHLREYIGQLLKTRDDGFGNARVMRNLFEKSITFHANRLMGMNTYKDSELSKLSKADIVRSIGT